MATQAETIAAIGPYLPFIVLSIGVLIAIFIVLVLMRVISLGGSDGWETPGVGEVWMMYHPGNESQEILGKKAVGHCYLFRSDLMPDGFMLERHQWDYVRPFPIDGVTEIDCYLSFDGLFTNSTEYMKKKAQAISKTNAELYGDLVIERRNAEKKKAMLIASTRSKDEIKNESISDEYVKTNIIKEKMLKFLMKLGRKGKNQSIYGDDEKDGEHEGQ
ncbi:MAG: hypothetical protein EPO20_30510 [Betaproteobacteria bacterium]|nr:MAG: hypothetical protein EPO20_30510 [Betaproteobacteria bacterium]